jgi:hypothetical protein
LVEHGRQTTEERADGSSPGFGNCRRMVQVIIRTFSHLNPAGDATEADAAGADLKSISDMLTHAEPRTTLRYIRSTNKRVRAVAKARAANREAAEPAAAPTLF